MRHRFSTVWTVGLPLTVGVVIAATSFGDETDSGKTPADAANATKYQLAYRFGQGQVVHSIVEQTSRMATKFRGKSETTESISKAWRHYTVLYVEKDGAGLLELRIDKVHMTSKFGEGELDVFKSDDKNYHPEGQAYKQILDTIGKPTARISYSPAGKLLQVVGADGKAFVAPKNGPPKNHQGFLIPLPAEPVAVGERWLDEFEQTVSLEDGLTQNVKMLRTYRLKSVEENRAEITFKTAILSPVNGRIRAQLLQREIFGTVTLDLALGAIVARTVKVNGQIINPFGQGSSMRAVSTLTEKLVAAKPAVKAAQAASAGKKQ